MNFKIGVFSASFRIGLRKGIVKANEFGVDGVQMFAKFEKERFLNPDNLTKEKRKDLKDFVQSNGLVISALCGELGQPGFTDKEQNKFRIEKTKKILQLASDLGTTIVTSHIGLIPKDVNHPRWEIIHKACEKIGEYAEELGIYYAIETGPEKAFVMKKFLDSLNSKRIKINFDPANLVMVAGDDPVEAVETLKEYIVHTHAKDGIRKKYLDTEVLFNYSGNLRHEGFNVRDYYQEVPLGEGHVDFDKYLKMLEKIGYKGFLTIEREVGDNPESDIRKAVEFLKSKMI